ncbi:3-hydroxyacyl-CoA dehydrogenase [Alkalihalobacillus sp. LMS6]|uniref:3-hydroxyacyl-CoA dehydrogenase n=1 Tax=Alkalihalobacillus sp. LMS6 TaxID=2924034 RepID=UPI0020D18FE4|nr:3-hydroxyacyl-CoA dehydrogenase [Alkalihalobacillus sp. LMS6]UTR07293.1 3-hydroxyacyl-CoA dehydrogenase [Alkalihalobacillus sp. LMS6]
MQSIAVIGSGVMGRGIAYVAARAGFQTNLVDIDDQALAQAKSSIQTLVQKGLDRGKITEYEKDVILNGLQFYSFVEPAVSDVDVVIEAVPEIRNSKQKVFEQMEQFTRSDCLFATNTSTMSPTEIGSYGKRAEKTIAMHFFNPVHQMKLVEIVRGLETSDETVAAVKQIADKMGKETVVINEFPGFVTSRMSALVGNEAFFMLQEGLGTPEEIDKAIKLGLNYPMGPFELGDLVGLDTRLNNLKYLHEKLGEKYRPAPLLEQYVQAGRLGRKSGKGVFDYTKNEVTT